MNLRWIRVNDSLLMSHTHKGHDYRIRASFEGDYIVIDENRDTGSSRRERRSTETAAIELAETWAS